MRIAFFGASDLGYSCCEALLNAGHNIIGIFTIPQNFSIKYSDEAKRSQVSNVLYKDFHVLGNQFQIPVVEIEGKVSTYTDQLKQWEPDFILAIGWYYMLPDQMVASAGKGAAGIHGSLLPKYRGNAPFVWAMINGEEETGVSFFYFEKGVDEGDIIAQESIRIEEDDTIKNILEKAKQESIKLLLDNLPKIAAGTSSRKPQPETGASYFPKRTPDDGLIDWSWNAKKIKNFIRAQTKPYPGAFSIIDGKKITIWDADIIDINKTGII